MKLRHRRHTRRKQLVRQIVAIGMFCGGCGDAGPAQNNPPKSSNLRVNKDSNIETEAITADYIPDVKCRSCHKSLYESYQQVSMAHAFYRPSPDRNIEDFEHSHYYHAPSHRHYQMIRDGDDIYLRRFQLDESNHTMNLLEQRVDWVLGSGERCRTYLFQTASGELFQLPIAWYTRDGQWGMAPGYDHADHFGFSRLITRDCMFCHNALPELPVGSDRLGQPSVYPNELPEGIGCQRCHGPGHEHARLADQPHSTLQSVRKAIYNPADASPDRRDDVCLQCHLQPEAVAFKSIFRRFGSGDFSYRPGDPLEDHLIHIDRADPHAAAERFEINHHPYRLRRSRCYTESAGSLHCVTCHDPHWKPVPAESSQYFSSKCGTCHTTDACSAPEMQTHEDVVDNCIECHMPKRRASDAVRVVVTDHFIRRRPPEADLLRELPEAHSVDPVEIKLYFTDRAPAEPMKSVYTAIAQMNYNHPATIEFALEAVRHINPAEPDPHIQLASALLQTGRASKALSHFLRADELSPNRPMVIAGIGAAYGILNKNDRAIEYYRKTLQLDPRDATTHCNLAAQLTNRRQYKEAIEHLNESIRLRPHYAKAYYRLGIIYTELNQWTNAVSAFEHSLAADPKLVDAYSLWARSLRETHEWSDSLRVLRLGLFNHRDNIALSAQLSETLLIIPDASLRNDRLALRLALTAANRDPRNGYHFTLIALAALKNGHHENAKSAAEMAIRLGGSRQIGELISAVARHHLGEEDAALRSYNECVAQWPRHQSNDPLTEFVRKSAEEFFKHKEPSEQ